MLQLFKLKGKRSANSNGGLNARPVGAANAGLPAAKIAKSNIRVKMFDMTTSKAVEILNKILNSYDRNMASYIEHLWVDSNNKNIVYIHFNNSVVGKYLSIIMLMREFPVPELPDEDTNFKIPDDTPNKETLDEIIDRISSSKEEIIKAKKRKEFNNSEQRAYLTAEQWEKQLGIAGIKAPDRIPLFVDSPCFMKLYDSVIAREPEFLSKHTKTIAKIALTLPVDMSQYDGLLAQFLSGTTYIHTKLASVFEIMPSSFSGYKIADTRILHELYTVLILSLVNIYESVAINNIYAIAYLMNQAGRFTIDTTILRAKFFDVIQDVLETYGSPIRIKYDCHINSRRSNSNIKNIEYTCGRYIEIDADNNTILIKQTVSMTNNTIMNNAGSKKHMEPYAVPAKQCMTGGYGTLTGARLSSRTLKHLIKKFITKTKKRNPPKRKHRTAKRL
jgi:hypothetical protein